MLYCCCYLCCWQIMGCRCRQRLRRTVVLRRSCQVSKVASEFVHTHTCIHECTRVPASERPCISACNRRTLIFIKWWLSGATQLFIVVIALFTNFWFSSLSLLSVLNSWRRLLLLAVKRATTTKLGGTKFECCQCVPMLVVVVVIFFSIIVVVIVFVAKLFFHCCCAKCLHW